MNVNGKRKGRGAVGNPAGRFESTETVPFDDGWSPAGTIPQPQPTQVIVEKIRSIISRNDSPDIPFSQSINPYRGCEHGCIYCFARPTHSYLGLSPGLDFETRLFSKPEAPRKLREELRRPGYRCRMIAMGSNTDPYQPLERRLEITRRLMEVLQAFNHPFSVVTKSDLVLRDLDLLAALARAGLVFIMLSITTLDGALARRMEPRATVPLRRLRALKTLAAAGVPVGVLASPMIPGLNDAEMEKILQAAADAGASWAGYSLVRLPYQVADLFRDWLEENYPLRRNRVLGRIRQTRSGHLTESGFSLRMKGSGAHAQLLKQRFHLACRRYGLAVDFPQPDCSKFRVPGRALQGKLFSHG